MLFVYVLLCLSSSFDHVDHLTILENSKKKTVDQFDNGMKLFYIQDTNENMSLMSFRIEIDDNPLNIDLYHLLEHCIVRGKSFFKEFIAEKNGIISANTDINNMKISVSVPTIYFLESIELFYNFIYKLDLTNILIQSEIMRINEEFIGKNLAENPIVFYKFYRLTGNSEYLNENYFDWYYNCYLKKGVFLDRENVKNLDNNIVGENKDMYCTYRLLINNLYNTKFKKSPFSFSVKSSLPLEQIKKRLSMFNKHEIFTLHNDKTKTSTSSSFLDTIIHKENYFYVLICVEYPRYSKSLIILERGLKLALNSMLKLEHFFFFFNQFDGKLEITIKFLNFKDLNAFEMLLDINYWAAFADNLNVGVLKKVLTDTNIKFKNDETTKNSLYLLITTLLSINNIDFHKNKDKEAFFDEDVVTDLYSSISTLENIHDLVYRNNEFMRDPEITLEEDFIRLKKQLLDIRNYKVVLISDNEESKSKRIFFYKYFNDLFTVRKENYCCELKNYPENIELINLDSKTSALVFVFTADSNLKNNDEINIFSSFLKIYINLIKMKYNCNEIIFDLNIQYNRLYFRFYGQNVVLKRFLKFFDFLLPYVSSKNETYKYFINNFSNDKILKDNFKIPKEHLKSELLKNGHILRLMMKLDTKIIYIGPKDNVVEKTILNIQKRCHLRKLFEKVKICSNDSLIGEVETRSALKTISFYLVLMEPCFCHEILINKMCETLFLKYFREFFTNNCGFIYYKGFKVKNIYNPNVIEIFIQSTLEIEQLYKIIRDLHEFFNNKIDAFSKEEFSLLKETVKNKLQVEDFRNPSHIMKFLKNIGFLIDFKDAKHYIDVFLTFFNDMDLFKSTLKFLVANKFIFPREYLLFINEQH